jgi:hypothetical protein
MIFLYIIGAYLLSIIGISIGNVIRASLEYNKIVTLDSSPSIFYAFKQGLIGFFYFPYAIVLIGLLLIILIPMLLLDWYVIKKHISNTFLRIGILYLVVLPVVFLVLESFL